MSGWLPQCFGPWQSLLGGKFVVSVGISGCFVFVEDAEDWNAMVLDGILPSTNKVLLFTFKIF